MQDIVPKISNNKKKGSYENRLAYDCPGITSRSRYTHKSSNMIVNIPKYILID
jgi:hypothetical protein